MDFREVTELFKDTFKYILVVVFVFLLFIFVVGIEQVVGPSMNPTLKEGNVIIVNKLLYRLKNIERNDIVVLSQEEKHMIKRVVGLPGDYIEYKDNYLYVNGVKYKEKFIKDVVTEDFSLKDLGYDKIPEDMYLVLGDNRENSRDSRNYGLIKKDQIIGKTWAKIWPIKNFKLF